MVHYFLELVVTRDYFYCLQSYHRPVVQLTNRLLRFWADGGFVYYKRVSSPSFLVSAQNLIVVTMSWFAIALDEIRTRRILREKANCKQPKICLVHRFLNEGLVACVQTHPPTSISFRGGDFLYTG